jgi:hypothetical protein
VFSVILPLCFISHRFVEKLFEESFVADLSVHLFLDPFHHVLVRPLLPDSVTAHNNEVYVFVLKGDDIRICSIGELLRAKMYLYRLF